MPPDSFTSLHALLHWLCVLLMNLRSFWSSVKSVDDPGHIWHNLCEGGSKERQGVHLCQKFPGLYATHRKRFRVSRGSEKKEAKRTVNHGGALLNIWMLLVLSFNRTVLVRKRRENPAGAAWWTLDSRRVCSRRRVKGLFMRSFEFVIPLQSLSLSTYRHLSY